MDDSQPPSSSLLALFNIGQARVSLEKSVTHEYRYLLYWSSQFFWAFSLIFLVLENIFQYLVKNTSLNRACILCIHTNLFMTTIYITDCRILDLGDTSLWWPDIYNQKKKIHLCNHNIIYHKKPCIEGIG